MAPDGSYTTYAVHRMPCELWEIRTEPDPDHPLDVLLALTAGPWAAVLDDHGVSRAHVRVEPGTAGMFLHLFGSGPDLRWVHAGHDGKSDPGAWWWTVLDQNLELLRTGAADHDVRLLKDGSALLMTFRW